MLNLHAQMRLDTAASWAGTKPQGGSICLRQVPPPCQPSPLGGGCSNDSDYDDVDDNVARDDDAELALGQRWDWLQLADFVLNVAQVDRGQAVT